MGCCSSTVTNRVKEPERVMTNKEDYIEDEKDGGKLQGKYEKKDSLPHVAPMEPSNKPYDDKASAQEVVMSPDHSPLQKSRQGLIDNEPNRQASSDYKEEKAADIEVYKVPHQEEDIARDGINSKKMSRDLAHVEQKEDKRDYERWRLRSSEGHGSRPKLQSDESTYKITREQHEQILKFVDERSKSLKTGTYMLYNLLSVGILREDDGLPFVLEDLKSGNKDIENCLDDVTSYKFKDEKTFLENLANMSDLIKRIMFSYGTMKKNLKNYKDFREEVLAALWAYDSKIEENTFMYMRQNMNGYYHSEKPPGSLPFIPRDDSQRTEEHQTQIMEDQFDLRLELN